MINIWLEVRCHKTQQEKCWLKLNSRRGTGKGAPFAQIHAFQSLRKIMAKQHVGIHFLVSDALPAMLACGLRHDLVILRRMY